MELPAEFKKYAIEALGEDTAAILLHEIENGSDITSLRINPFKGNVPAEGVEKVAWSSLGHYLPERPVFTLDPVFHSGGYYVQEASSMYMELVRDAIEADFAATGGEGKFFSHNISALDLCAAPGGKSTHLASLLGEDSILVSNEVIKSRATILADNIAKWGADNVVVTNNDPADFSRFEEYFHLVVVDAPCSGEGLFRKDPQAVQEWSPANVNLCAQRQQRILADIWPALRPGGYLVYSTCTYNKFENDGNLSFLESLGAHIVTLSSCTTPSESGIITTPAGGLQFVPGKVKGEGQFMAIVRKGGDFSNDTLFAPHQPVKGKKNSRENKDMQQDKGCNYLPDNYIKFLKGDLVKGYRKSIYEKIRFVEERLRVVLSGTAIATKKGKDYIPHADLALQNTFNRMVANGNLPKGIAAVEVGREDALKFLAKEPVVLADAPLGYVLLVYGGLGLGFVKNLGNRSNNLHPMARRIRMNING